MADERRSMNILFDVAGTLIDDDDEPIVPMVRLLITLGQYSGHRVYVASDGGVIYASRWCKKLGIDQLVTVIEKYEHEPMDLSFDDQEVDFGLVNCQVKLGSLARPEALAR